MKEREKIKKDNIKKISLLGNLKPVKALCEDIQLASSSSSVEEDTNTPPTKPTTPLIPLDPAKRVITAYYSYCIK